MLVGIGNFGVSMYLCKGEREKFKQMDDVSKKYMYFLSDFVEFAKANGFQTIELIAFPLIPASVLSEISTNIKTTISGFRNVTYHLPIYEINICAFNPGIRREAVEETKRHIDICVEVGIGNVVMHPGVFDAMPKWYALVEDMARSIAEKSIFEIFDYCKDRGIGLSLENLHRNEPLFQRPDEFEPFVEKGLGFVLDTAHAFECSIDPIDFIKRFASNITEVHLSDGIKSDPVTHYPIGNGEVDCLAVLDELQRINFTGPIILEVESKRDLISSKNFLRERAYPSISSV